jgi:hypothetical protein
MTWNNLGVTLQEFKLPVKSVDAYRKSEEMNETLAMANLGYKMLGAGFLSEARAICERALATKNAHKNVGHLLVRLNEISAEEDKTQAEVLENSRSKIEFYRDFGRAVGLAEPHQIGGVWVGPECRVTATVKAQNVQIIGYYERDANPFGLAIGMLSSNQKVRQRVEYRGALNGRAIFANVRRTEDGGGSAAATSLLAFIGEEKVLMFVSNDETEISVFENPSSLNPKVFKLSREAPGMRLIAPTVPLETSKT